MRIKHLIKVAGLHAEKKTVVFFKKLSERSTKHSLPMKTPVCTRRPRKHSRHAREVLIFISLRPHAGLPKFLILQSTLHVAWRFRSHVYAVTFLNITMSIFMCHKNTEFLCLSIEGKHEQERRMRETIARGYKCVTRTHNPATTRCKHDQDVKTHREVQSSFVSFGACLMLADGTFCYG